MFVSNVETGLRFAIADDRLRREVEDRVDLVLAEHALERAPGRGRRRARP